MGVMMESKIARALNLKYQPVAIVWTDEKPEKAISFKKGKWGCVMWLLASAAKGKVAVCDRETYGCWGGGVGLGFGNQYHNFPGGIQCFYYFLAEGNNNWETGRMVAKKLESVTRHDFIDDFLNGERYVKSHELVEKFIESLPIIDIPNTYVVFKPLDSIDVPIEEPKVVVFIGNPHQISALVVLANYYREGSENVAVPYAAGCQQIGILAYKEAQSNNPRGILGLTDISARKNVKNQLGDDVMTFTVPWKMFMEMEEHAEGSFLQRKTIEALKG